MNNLAQQRTGLAADGPPGMAVQLHANLAYCTGCNDAGHGKSMSLLPAAWVLIKPLRFNKAPHLHLFGKGFPGAPCSLAPVAHDL